MSVCVSVCLCLCVCVDNHPMKNGNTLEMVIRQEKMSKRNKRTFGQCLLTFERCHRGRSLPSFSWCRMSLQRTSETLFLGWFLHTGICTVKPRHATNTQLYTHTVPTSLSFLITLYIKWQDSGTKEEKRSKTGLDSLNCQIKRRSGAGLAVILTQSGPT